MSTMSDPAGPSPATNAVSGPAAPAPDASTPEEQRWFSLRSGGRARQFARSLQSKVRWTKEFLHGRR